MSRVRFLPYPWYITFTGLNKAVLDEKKSRQVPARRQLQNVEANIHSSRS